MKPTIALLVPTTSRKCNFKSANDTPIVQILGRSMDSLLQPELFNYVLYLGYDPDDTWYTTNATKVSDSWSTLYPRIQIHMVQLDLTTTLVSKWNLLFIKALSDDCDYFYQLGDDIRIIDPRWEQEFIAGLVKNNGFGVTGPLDINNSRILTQSFTSKRHHEIFGFYFHPRISNWYCDDWITHVYPKTMTYRTKCRVQNMSGSTCRYVIDSSPKDILGELLVEGRKIITDTINELNGQ
jgi:hypothetical protein